MIRPIAPSHSVLRSILSPREIVARYESPLMEDEATLAPLSPFTVVEESFTASNVPKDTLDHWEWLHKMGREPHIDAVLHLLQNYQDDGNRFHLVQAIEVLTHLKSL